MQRLSPAARRLLRESVVAIAIWSVLAGFEIVRTFRNPGTTKYDYVVLPLLLGYWGRAALTVGILSLFRTPLFRRANAFVTFALNVVLFFAVMPLLGLIRVVVLLSFDDPLGHHYGQIMATLFGPQLISQMWMHGAVVVSCYAVLHYEAARAHSRVEAELRTALVQQRLDTLALQLQPHFVFNTLNGIVTLIDSDPEAARTALIRFSDLLRTAVNQARSNDATVGEEVAFVDAYLTLQRMRIGPRMTWSITVDPTVTDAKVPTMLLQPIVENAVRYGIESRRCPGKVEVEVTRDADRIRMTVSNSALEGAAVPAPQGLGIALRNIRERLYLRYGERSTLDFVKSNDLSARVVVEVPFEAAP
ncbi:MAG TPA: histidine kinase [Thermoanaerobaculia bacterium]